MNRYDALQLVESARSARLATISAEGLPHVVPITFAVDGDQLVTAVDHKPKRSRDLQRLENIKLHPQVSVLVDHYSDDWDSLWWVRIDGAALVLSTGEGFERAIDALVAKYAQYQVIRPAGPAVRVTMERVVGWKAA